MLYLWIITNNNKKRDITPKTINSTFVFNFTTPGIQGQFNVSWTVNDTSDNIGLGDEVNFTINNSPIFAGNFPTVSVEKDKTALAIFNLNSFFSDDGDTLSFIEIGTGEPFVQITADGTVNIISTSSEGTFEVIPGSTLLLTGGTFTQSPPGTISGGGAVDFTSVIFFGEGDITADVNNNSSQFNPGAASPGILNDDGSYTHSGSAAVNIELDGPDPGTGFDQFNITDNAALPGVFNISTIDSFVPNPCQSFEIVTYGSRSGPDPTFTGLKKFQTAVESQGRTSPPVTLHLWKFRGLFEGFSGTD